MTKAAIEHSHNVVVVDTPGHDTFLMRLAHSMADMLITPINDSFLDFDALATLDPINFTVTGESHYAKIVREARRQRREFDGRLTTGLWCEIDYPRFAWLAQQAPSRRGTERTV